MTLTYNTVPSKSSSDYYVVAMWLDYVRTNIENLITPAMCHGSVGSTTLTHNVAQVMTPSSGSFTVDTDNFWTAANPSRLTVETPGLYINTGYVGVQLGSAQIAKLFSALAKNGSNYTVTSTWKPVTSDVYGTTHQYMAPVGMIDMADTDYFEVWAWHYSSGGLAATWDGKRFACCWLGETS